MRGHPENEFADKAVAVVDIVERRQPVEPL